MNTSRDKFEKFMASKKFDVEHALGMYAYSFCDLPAEGIYNSEMLNKMRDVLENCHIYLVGYVPRMDLKSINQSDNIATFQVEVLGRQYPVELEVPDGLSLRQEDGWWFFSNASGDRFNPPTEKIAEALAYQHDCSTFEVVYVGQAYGKDGSRNAIDRLKKHETLQKISLKGVPEGYRLQLLLLEIHPSNQLFTSFNPFAQETDEGEDRIKKGLDKLFGTSEKERITLYEAALIRYFQPQYNKEFKNSFPSTNMKILSDCYDKDFACLVAEICFENFHYKLFSQSVEKKFDHVVNIPLHTEEERRIFFSG